MTPSITAVRMTGSAHRAELPLLVLGPSLDTSAMTTWSACAAGLTEEFDVVAWDLPGQGHNRSVPEEPFTMAELASGVLAVIDDILVQREDAGGRFYYAGDSVGGVVGLQLLLDAPGRVSAAVVLYAGESPGAGADELFDPPVESGVPVLELFGPAYLDPVESPDELARLLRQQFLGDDDPGRADANAAANELAHEVASAVQVAIAHGVDVAEVRRVLLAAASLGPRSG